MVGRAVRTEQWAKRYGGRFEAVTALLESAKGDRRNKRWLFTGLSAGVALLVVVAAGLFWSQRRQQAVAEENFLRSAKIAETFLKDVKYALNHGNMNLDAAAQMESTAEKVVEDLSAHSRDSRASNNTKALTIDLYNVSSDILGRRDPDASRNFVLRAERLAEQLVEADQKNDEWQNLLFQSKFRFGDIRGSDYKNALKQYQQAEAIIHLLADKYPDDDRHPETGEHHYFLAFITAKIGTAYWTGDHPKEALQYFRAAWGFARALAERHPYNPEWQALVPSTMTKIGDAHVASSAPEWMAALHEYDAAMAYQRSLITDFPTDSVINSNFTSTLRNRAGVLAQIGQWQEAEAQFDEAVGRREGMLASDMGNVPSLTYLAADYKPSSRRSSITPAWIRRLRPSQRPTSNGCWSKPANSRRRRLRSGKSSRISSRQEARC